MHSLPALFFCSCDVGGVIVDEQDVLMFEAIHRFEFLINLRLRFDEAMIAREDAAIKAAHESVAL